MISTLRPTIILLFFAVTSSAYRLSYEENERLQATCGRSENQRNTLGVKANPESFPFAVSVNLKGVLSASVISPRHIILFNIVESLSNGTLSFLDDMPFGEDVSCENEHMILPEDVNSWFDINFATQQNYTINVSRVIVFNGCEKLALFNPMIIELTNDLQFDREHQPICISNSSDDFTLGMMDVFGFGPRGKQLTSTKIRYYPCMMRDIPLYSICGEVLNKTQGFCAGDFGGGAVLERFGRSVLVGILTEGNVRCGADPATHAVPQFINLGWYAKKICEVIGVCVESLIQTTTETTTETTTTESYYTAEPIEVTISEEVNVTPEPIEMVEAVKEQNVSGIETLVAETFEKMKLGTENTCSKDKKHSGHVKNIHVHVHLEK